VRRRRESLRGARSGPGTGSAVNELLASAVILLVVTGLALECVHRGHELTREEVRIGLLHSRAMRIVESVVDDIRSCGSVQIAAGIPDGDELDADELRVIELYPEEGSQLSAAPVSYSLPLEGVEQERWWTAGVDDDGDGLIDERALIRTTPGGRSTVIATGVKGWDSSESERIMGFRARRIPGTGRIRVSLWGVSMGPVVLECDGSGGRKDGTS